LHLFTPDILVVFLKQPGIILQLGVAA